MQNILGDTCAVGDYSHYPEAICAQKSWSAPFPGLVDYALTCTEVEAEALRTTFVGVVAGWPCTAAPSGFLGAPVRRRRPRAHALYWLMLADKYDRQLLRVFLEEVEAETLSTEEEKKRALARKQSHVNEDGDGGKEYDIPVSPYTVSSLDLSNYFDGKSSGGGGAEANAKAATATATATAVADTAAGDARSLRGNSPEAKVGVRRKSTMSGFFTDAVHVGEKFIGNPRTVRMDGERVPTTRKAGSVHVHAIHSHEHYTPFACPH